MKLGAEEEMADYGKIEISAELTNETDKAFQLFDGDKAVWVPKSQEAWLIKLAQAHALTDVCEAIQKATHP